MITRRGLLAMFAAAPLVRAARRNVVEVWGWYYGKPEDLRAYFGEVQVKREGDPLDDPGFMLKEWRR
jgi:hypothetical protein